MNSAVKWTLIVLGVLSALLIVSQLVLGLQILGGAAPAVQTAHQHSGYMTVVVSLLYIAGSLVAIGSIRSRPKG
ncbi:hypothetical protein BH23PLA1_BH23PLA1_24720 [soil metagenome]